MYIKFVSALRHIYVRFMFLIIGRFAGLTSVTKSAGLWKKKELWECFITFIYVTK